MPKAYSDKNTASSPRNKSKQYVIFRFSGTLYLHIYVLLGQTTKIEYT